MKGAFKRVTGILQFARFTGMFRSAAAGESDPRVTDPDRPRRHFTGAADKPEYTGPGTGKPYL